MHQPPSGQEEPDEPDEPEGSVYLQRGFDYTWVRLHIQISGLPIFFFIFFFPCLFFFFFFSLSFFFVVLPFPPPFFKQL